MELMDFSVLTSGLKGKPSDGRSKSEILVVEISEGHASKKCLTAESVDRQWLREERAPACAKQRGETAKPMTNNQMNAIVPDRSTRVLRTHQISSWGISGGDKRLRL
jgi:hypothetical protein